MKDEEILISSSNMSSQSNKVDYRFNELWAILLL